MPKVYIRLPKQSLENKKFSKEEQLTVVKMMLNSINLTILRSRTFNIKIRKFGIIHSHGNKKARKNKYQERYNKASWKKQKLELEFSEKKLLY